VKKEDLIARLDLAGINYSDYGKEIFAEWGYCGLYAIVSEADECKVSMRYYAYEHPVFGPRFFSTIEEAQADFLERMKPYLRVGFDEHLLEYMRL
jgi:hypothetical protein